jgi:hypothetical protein
MRPLYLGKLPARVDGRNILLKAIIRKELLPTLPESFNVDEALGGIDDERMFANDIYGNCVVAMKAHNILRTEKFEQGLQPVITDQEVIDQYLKETGGPDIGLYLLESLKTWRKEGFPIGGRNYNIYAFAAVNWRDHDEVKHCIHLLNGVNFGMLVYQSAMNQFGAGQPWTVVANPGKFLGGHGVYLYGYDKEEEDNNGQTCSFAQAYAGFGNGIARALGRSWRVKPYRLRLTGYDSKGLVCMTWGARQYMTWGFWDAYVDEAYGVVDNRDEWLGENSPVDVELLDSYLAEITQ